MHRVLSPLIIVLSVSLLPFSQAEAKRPNILLIVSDDQGYDDLGLLGNGIITPSLDRLAKEGVRLTNFYVSWPACTPSRASLLTGRYPQRNGIRHDPQRGARLRPQVHARGIRGHV